MLLLAFLDRAVQHAAAVIAGLGFGTFIDEIGKFVTADNDYFYRPAVALIYGLFVVAFLVARTLVGQRRLSEGEALANVLDFLASVPKAGIEPDDRARLERLLANADPTSARTRFARQYLEALPSASAHQTWIETAYRRLADGYDQVMANPWAERALVVGVIGYAALAVMGVTILAVANPTSGAVASSTVATPAQIGSTIAGALLVGRGVLSLNDSRMSAYHWFVRGILVWILVTQVFVFYSSQLAGLGGLVVDLIAYGSLRFALAREMAAGALPKGAAPRSTG
jgi:hypothetical protein